MKERKGRFGSSEAKVLKQGELEDILPWHPFWGEFPERARPQSYR